jgi:uncharacterized BrkB/YihY/UPF0761 family membrane protein
MLSMNVPGPSLRGLWALFWHMVVLLPVGLALFAVVVYAGIGLLVLPVAAGVFVWNADGWRAAVCVALWLPSWWWVRWFWRRERSDEFDHRGDV